MSHDFDKVSHRCSLSQRNENQEHAENGNYLHATVRIYGSASVIRGGGAAYSVGIFGIEKKRSDLRQDQAHRLDMKKAKASLTDENIYQWTCPVILFAVW